MARSTFYYYLKKYKSNHDKYHKIKKEIFKFNENKGRYGYRRITLELKNRGFNINHKTVSKFMNILGIKSIQRPKRRYNSYQGNIGKIANNLLKHPTFQQITDMLEKAFIKIKK